MYRTTLPAATAQAVPISSWTNIDNSIPGLAGWTYITSVNDPTYTLTSTAQNFAFNGFVLPASSASTMTLGIMFVMMNNLDSTGTPDQLLFDEVSLCHSDFAVKAAPETADEALRKCQFYFEKSYEPSVLPATNSVFSSLARPMTVDQGAGVGYAAPWEFEYKTVKRAVPTVTFYAIDGTVNNVLAQIYRAGVLEGVSDTIIASFWNAYQTGTRSITYVPTVPAPGAIVAALGAGVNLSCSIFFQYTAQALLGV
jgi:hypothetical protein